MRKTATLDFSKLLGFATVRGQISECFDFRDETVGARLGAKVGGEVTNTARKLAPGSETVSRSRGETGE